MFSLRKNLQNRTDEELMLHVCNNDERAFTELYMRYSQKMLRFFYRMTNDEEKCQDLLQNLFLRIIEDPKKYDSSQQFSPWLYKIAANMCLNELRNSKNRLRLLNENLPDYNQEFIDVQSLDLNVFSDEYKKHFTQLEPEQQLLLTLRFQQELTVKEIAQIMSLPEGTIKSRLFYLLKKLSVLLQEFNPAT